jgi:sulfur carrier protein ThiS adenylyltransferase
MVRQLASVNPCVRVVAHPVVLDEENIGAVFRGVDVLLECLDRAEAKAMIIRAAAVSLPDTWLVGASGVAGYGDSNSIRTVRLGDRVFMVGDMVSAAEPGRGLMAPRVGIAAHHQANLAVGLILHGEDAAI